MLESIIGYDIDVGTFRIENSNGNVIVGDPCYEIDSDGIKSLSNVKRGVWFNELNVVNTGIWGERVYSVICVHKDYKDVEFYSDELKHEFMITVDSGQAGVFDSCYFKGGDDEEWYNICCKKTLSFAKGGVIENGVVSSTGYGDGVYSCKTISRDGAIILITIIFIGEDDGKEEEEIEDDEEEDLDSNRYGNMDDVEKNSIYEQD